MSGLSASLLQALGQPGGTSAELEAELSSLCERAQHGCPEAAIDGSEFLKFVGERVDPTQPLSPALQSLRWEELYLAFACSRGHSAAARRLETQYFPEVRRAIESVRGMTAASVQDLLQTLRQRLLVGPPPRITDYLGRGPLAGWLCTAGVRAALDSLRRTGREVVTDELGPLMEVSVDDPELEVIRRQFQSEFRRAFKESVGTLEDRQRTVLQMNVVDGLNIDEIGRVYGVHRSTVARWIAASREQILVETKRSLARQLTASDSEVESLIQLLDSRLEMSLHSMLQVDKKH